MGRIGSFLVHSIPRDMKNRIDVTLQDIVLQMCVNKSLELTF